MAWTSNEVHATPPKQAEKQRSPAKAGLLFSRPFFKGAILKSAKDRLDWQSASAESHARRGMQLDLLQIDRNLIRVNERAAGVMAGRILELYLHYLGAFNEVKLRKQFAPLRELFDAFKEAGILDTPVHAQGIWASEIASRCRADGESPSKVQVRDLIDNAHWFLSNLF